MNVCQAYKAGTWTSLTKERDEEKTEWKQWKKRKYPEEVDGTLDQQSWLTAFQSEELLFTLH